jgi:outer membrane receptor for ferrienterochelin and colicins
MQSTNEGKRRAYFFWIQLTILAIFSTWSTLVKAQVEENDYSLDSLLNIKISSASKYEQTTAEAPSSVTILTTEDIRDFGWDHVGEALNAVRSLYLSDDRNYQYLGVWGFSRPTDFNNRVLVLVDGHTLNEPLWGTGPLALELQGLNIEMLERIEVLRGPSSSLYGNYAMQAIINLVFKEGRQMNGVKISAETGTAGHYQVSIGAGKRFSNGLDVSLAMRANTFAGQNLYFADYNDSLNNFGISDHKDSRKGAGLYLQASWKNLKFRGMYTDRRVYYPTGAYGTEFNGGKSYNEDGHGFAELSYKHVFSGKQEFSIRLYGDYFDYFGGYAFADSVDGDLREKAQVLWGGAEARFQVDLLTNNRLIVGVEGNRYFKASYDLSYEFSGPYLSLNNPFTTYSFFVQDEYQITNQLSITGGLRFDQQIYENRALNPRLAVIYHPLKKTTLKLSYAQAFRSPSVTELEVNDSTFVLGNDQLRPEKIRSFQLVWEQRIGKNCWVSATLYNNQIIGLIEPVADSNGYFVNQNLSSAIGSGAEGEFNFSLAGGAHFYSNATVQLTRNALTDAVLTNSPAIMVKSGVSLPIFNHFRFSQDALFESGRLTIYDTKTNPFVLLNSQLMFDPQFNDATGMKKQLNRIRLYFRVRNLLNTVYAYPGGTEHLMPAIIQNGRNFIAKIQFTF